MRDSFVILLIIIGGCLPCAVQAEEKPKACRAPAYHTLDFWVGSWTVSWEGGSGTNVIAKTHGGCIVQETFSSPELKGMSLSMYDNTAGEWRQTWMDDQGSYFDFHGRKAGSDYIFHSIPDSKKPNHQLRMRFTDIQPDALTWLWQKTMDGGQTWQEMWRISYSRSK